MVPGLLLASILTKVVSSTELWTDWCCHRQSAMLSPSGLKMKKAALIMSCCIISWHYVCCHSVLSGIFDASETVYRWRSRLCLFSPTWWFRLVRVPEDCQVQSPWWCQIVPQESTLSSAKSHRTTVMFFNLLAYITAELYLIHLEMYFIVYPDL